MQVVLRSKKIDSPPCYYPSETDFALLVSRTVSIHFYYFQEPNFAIFYSSNRKLIHLPSSTLSPLQSASVSYTVCSLPRADAVISLFCSRCSYNFPFQNKSPKSIPWPIRPQVVWLSLFYYSTLFQATPATMESMLFLGHVTCAIASVIFSSFHS